MGLFLLALFIALVLAELTALAWVADAVGTFDALALLLLISLVGAWLTKRAGLNAARRARQAANEGRTPDRELADGVIIFVAGILLVVPGFVTGAVGALLLVPPVRALARVGLLRQSEKAGRMIMFRARVRTRAPSGDGVWDVDSWEDPGNPGSSREIGGPR